jgi:HTH-type transcriptional regulator/antitoxin HipB
MSYLLQTPDQLAVHLRALRVAKGWSQKQLAEKLGLSQSRIARIESDPLSISVDQLLKVLSAMGASVSIQLDANSNCRAAPAAQMAVTKSVLGDW